MSTKRIVILGGGLAGLSAASTLSKAGQKVILFERDSRVGGLAKTISHNGFRFDLGGHRFFTKNKKIEQFVKDLMDGELVVVSRKSKIYLRNRYFDYPLKPFNSVFGIGLPTTFKILLDYTIEKLKGLLWQKECISLKDWVVKNFGHKMFDIYFREYSEKVWGIECNRISMEWVAQRINGLSLGTAVRSAFFKFMGRDIATLADRFLYPSLGIGQISERLKEIIEKDNTLLTETSVQEVYHSDYRIKGVIVNNPDHTYTLEGDEFISTIPLTALIQILHPRPPEDVLLSASKLRYRDLIIVTVMLDRERVTEQTWIYIPEQRIPFSRIHEPKNWSPRMAPKDKTHIVIEYFCSEGDSIWGVGDTVLREISIKNLEGLGFIKRDEVIDSVVIKVPKAYPLFEVGYKRYYDKVIDYLSRFRNLHIAGRGGMFRYHNMDHAIETGIEAAERIIQNSK